MIQELRAHSRIHLLRVLFQNVLFRVPLLLHLSKSTSNKNNFFSQNDHICIYTSFQADLKQTCIKRRYQYQRTFRFGKMSSKIQQRYNNPKGLKKSTSSRKLARTYPHYIYAFLHVLPQKCTTKLRPIRNRMYLKTFVASLIKRY